MKLIEDLLHKIARISFIFPRISFKGPGTESDAARIAKQASLEKVGMTTIALITCIKE